jgi:glycerol-3-phosphate dehydrogenase (NAD(P)+)
VEINKIHENRKYLPGILLPVDGLRITASLSETVNAGTIVLAVPSFAIGDILNKLAPLLDERKVFINLAKGLDQASGRTMSRLITTKLDVAAVFTLAGPSHAEEVGRDIPTAVVLAGTDLRLGEQLQRAISTHSFRIYLSADIRGVELCSAVKNIIALATGVSDGLGYGDNSRGALITRGLAEMVRFGRVFGVEERTFFGLSGLGDLVATCTSTHSRNRLVGYRLGTGEPLADILAGMDMVAEGVYSTKVLHNIALKKGIEMPITAAVYRLLYQGADPGALVEEIMTRAPKREES